MERSGSPTSVALTSTSTPPPRRPTRTLTWYSPPSFLPSFLLFFLFYSLRILHLFRYSSLLIIFLFSSFLLLFLLFCVQTYKINTEDISVSIYTQITDVELECDGFFNYDRTSILSLFSSLFFMYIQPLPSSSLLSFSVLLFSFLFFDGNYTNSQLVTRRASLQQIRSLSPHQNSSHSVTQSLSHSVTQSFSCYVIKREKMHSLDIPK